MHQLQSFEAFRALVEDAPDIIARFDRQLRLVYVNPVVVSHFGNPQEFYLGRTPSEFGLPDDVAERLTHFIESVFTTGEKLQAEFELDAEEGHRWYQSQFSPEHSESGEVEFVLALIRDQTAFHIALLERSRSEQQYRQLVENASVGIYFTDIWGNYTFANQQCRDMLGYSLEEWQSSIYYDMVAPESRDMARRFYFRQFARKIPITHLELPMMHKDGSIRWISQNVSLIYENGEVVGFEGIATDITEQQLAKEKLREAKERAEELSRLKSMFLANMSHEIRTPMTGILGFASIIEEHTSDPDLKMFAERITRSASRLMDTLNAVLDLSKIESQKLDLELVPLELEREVSMIADFLSPIAANRHLTLRVNPSGKSIWATADRTALNQILNNLIGNALKFTLEGGVSIEIDTANSTSGRRAVIRVSDTGVGIPPEDLDRIFEEFHQVHGEVQHNGVGLGLSICRKLVELLHGEIFVESTVGVGSTFSVHLPLAEAPGAAEEPQELPPAHVSIDEPKSWGTVLMVEDRLESRELFQLFLGPYCKIEAAATAIEALRMARARVYDVILMDVNLGTQMDGLDVVRELRKLPQYERTPIAAVTAYAMQQDRERCLDAGCTAYLAKPLKRQDLIKMVHEMFQLRTEGMAS